jgi:hypothetical protein
VTRVTSPKPFQKMSFAKKKFNVIDTDDETDADGAKIDDLKIGKFEEELDQVSMLQKILL